MIEGLVWSRPSLLKLHDHNVVVRRDMAEDAALRDQRVALVSGTATSLCSQARAWSDIKSSLAKVEAADTSPHMLGLSDRASCQRQWQVWL